MIIHATNHVLTYETLFEPDWLLFVYADTHDFVVVKCYIMSTHPYLLFLRYALNCYMTT